MNVTKFLHAKGFDLSKGSRVGCSQCAAVVINGLPVHERGCPNEVHECRGCNAPVEFAGAYCQ